MKRAPVLIVLAALALAGGIAAAATSMVGIIGPSNRIQPSGRQLNPAGKLTSLGNLPAGGALTRDGRFLWTLSAGRGRNDIRIVSVRRAKILQVIPMPGLSGGMTFSPDGRTAYVSGLPDSPHADQRAPAGTPGLDGDVIHVFHVNRGSGRATRAGLIPVPPPSTAPIPQNFPPTNTKKLSWPRDMAISPNGRKLLVALNLADAAAVIDVPTQSVSYVSTGHYPYGAAITSNGRLGLVSNEADGTVSVIDMANARKLKDITVGPNLSHPEGIAIDPRRPRAYVAVASQDLVAVIDTAHRRVQRTLSVERPRGIGTEPVSVHVTPDGSRLLVADSGEDAIAVFALRRTKKPFSLVGRVPTASYPVDAEASHGRLVWVAAKGLGAGPDPNGPNPNSPNDSDDHINSFYYLPSRTFGMSGVLKFPSDKQLRSMTPVADRQVVPANSERPPAGTPLRAGGPIKHVFYIVRENRTYDQVLGDDPRGDGDPKLTLFGAQITPNMHALVRRFPLLDHVYANSEASIDGHFWTSASAVSDYVVKNWHQNYAGRQRPYDFGVYSVTWPAKGFLFDQALHQHISFWNYGEAVAGDVPLADKDRNAAETQEVMAKFAKSDLGPPTAGCYPNDAEIGTNPLVGGKPETWDSTPPPGAGPLAESRFDCFKRTFTAQLALGAVPAFNYFVLPSDHTQGTTPGARTPRAMIAENDYALGQIVDLISHSAIWKNSLILVVEDDSQDGADHVDAHRIPALAISPWTRRGAVVHTRYDFPSFIRTLELPLGMKPLNLFDALGVPLYDAFARKAVNGGPYNVIPPKVNINERNAASSPAAGLSAGLNLTVPDHVDQRTLDGILWKSIHGAKAKPPPPGPNASPDD